MKIVQIDEIQNFRYSYIKTAPEMKNSQLTMPLKIPLIDETLNLRRFYTCIYDYHDIK